MLLLRILLVYFILIRKIVKEDFVRLYMIVKMFFISTTSQYITLGKIFLKGLKQFSIYINRMVRIVRTD